MIKNISSSNMGITSASNVLLLTDLQYCHIIDNNTGIVRLVEGPYRGSLESNESIFEDYKKKVIVNEGQYTVILNPKELEGKSYKIKHGDREIRKGPIIFSLYPGEILENNCIYDENILNENEGLLVTATQDHEIDDNLRKAGDLWIIKGPSRYIPHKYTRIVTKVTSISLGINEGVYIKNILTGEIRLEKGPKSYMLSPYERLHKKEYSLKEINALKINLENHPFHKAIPLRLLESEYMMIVSEKSQRIEVGPNVILLEPSEHINIITISGSTPKIPNIIKKWKIFSGPVFVSDKLCVRTKDNAELSILLRYKTRFIVDAENKAKLFGVEDFIGFATETLAGMIREEAAKHIFEDFHSKAGEIIKSTIFNGNKNSYIFEENGFEIFSVDIKKIIPEDPEIAAQLNSAIKSNMDVYVKKIQQTAELQAEQELVLGKIKIEEAKKELITLEQENYRSRTLGAAEIDAEAAIRRAHGESEAMKEIKQTEYELYLERMKSEINQLTQNGGEAYIKLQQVLSLANVSKTIIVPPDSKLFVPMGDEMF